jgi:hypothetical protein
METVVARFVELPNRLEELYFLHILFRFGNNLNSASLGENRLEVQLINESNFLFEVRWLFLFLRFPIKVKFIILVIDLKYRGLLFLVQGHLQH